MAEFVCKVGTESGRVISQTEHAGSEEEIRQRLAGQGYYVFSVEPRQALKVKLGSIGKKKIATDDFMIFNQQFLTLSKSGLPLQKSLDLLAQQTHSEALRDALDGVRERIRGGTMLSEAFEAVGKFPKVYCATLRAGERSGNLDRVLSQYVAYQKIRRGFRKKFVSALIYPSILIVFVLILVTLVVAFIVPKFALLYSDVHAQLPPITLVVISLSQSLNRFALPVFLVLVAIVLVARMILRSPEVRMKWEWAKYRSPVVGKLMLKFSVAEFARTLSTLLQGGIPVVSALETAKSSVTSPLMSQAIAQAQREVTGGRPLNAGLRASGFFPPMVLDMVEVGETTGALPTMLEGVADFFEEDVSIDLATLVELVDPIMLSIIAVFVGFVLIAFYLPLFSMAAQVH